MLKKIIRFGLILAALMLAGTFAWAAGGRDVLRNQDITIGHWWGGYDVDTYKPADETGELTLEWRRRIQREHGFTIKEKQVAGWSEMMEMVTTSIMAGNPLAQAFLLQPDWAMALYRQGLLFPISDSKAVDLTTATPVAGRQIGWNQDIQELFKFDGKFYATSPLGWATQHANGLYFNKRLFREAGLDPDTPYNMQRDGTWTWNNFIDICKRLTRDRNNTGRIDTWAMPGDLEDRIFEQIVYSNGGSYVAKDNSGRFVNATGRPEFLEAMQFAKRLVDERVMMPRPENANWEWYWPMFHDGIVAMAVDPEWRRGELGTMSDDWGFVLFPKGPRSRDYRVANDDIAMIIPSTFQLPQVDVVLAGVNLWYMPVTDDWKASLWNSFRDRRAVDETMALIRDPRYSAFRYHIVVPGLQPGDIAWNIWGWALDPAQLVESVSQNWNALINDANR